MTRRQIVKEWLRSKHASTYGRSFDLIQNADEATDFFLKLWCELDDWEIDQRIEESLGQARPLQVGDVVTPSQVVVDPLPYA